MIKDDVYKSRTNNDLLTIDRAGIETVSASGRTEFAVLKEECTRNVFNRLYVFTGVNLRTGRPLGITKNMMIKG